MEIINRIAALFASRFGNPPALIVQASGRINLIGEHTDYNDGLVFPAAIDKALYFAIARSEHDVYNLVSADFQQEAFFRKGDQRAWQQELTPGGKSPQWLKYIRGVIDETGLEAKSSGGFNCVFGGDIPRGAGLSSSAALCAGTGFALNHLFDLKLSLIDLAKIAQTAEAKYAGVNCGIMDPFASLFGKKDHFIQLDCRSLEYTYVKAELGDFTLLLCDSQVKHSLASSAYNQRREECATGLSAVQEIFPDVKSLRDVDMDLLEKTFRQALSQETASKKSQMTEIIFRRCKYVIEENLRVASLASALRSNDLAFAGQLLFETHHGLSQEYEVSCPELDFLVQQAQKFPFVAGARMMGGGFGGCTINLIQKNDTGENNNLDQFKNNIAKSYNEAFKKDPVFYEVKISDGCAIFKK